MLLTNLQMSTSSTETIAGGVLKLMASSVGAMNATGGALEVTASGNSTPTVASLNLAAPATYSVNLDAPPLANSPFGPYLAATGNASIRNAKLQGTAQG